MERKQTTIKTVKTVVTFSIESDEVEEIILDHLVRMPGASIGPDQKVHFHFYGKGNVKVVFTRDEESNHE